MKTSAKILLLAIGTLAFASVSFAESRVGESQTCTMPDKTTIAKSVDEHPPVVQRAAVKPAEARVTEGQGAQAPAPETGTTGTVVEGD